MLMRTIAALAATALATKSGQNARGAVMKFIENEYPYGLIGPKFREWPDNPAEMNYDLEPEATEMCKTAVETIIGIISHHEELVKDKNIDADATVMAENLEDFWKTFRDMASARDPADKELIMTSRQDSLDKAVESANKSTIFYQSMENDKIDAKEEKFLLHEILIRELDLARMAHKCTDFSWLDRLGDPQCTALSFEDGAFIRGVGGGVCPENHQKIIVKLTKFLDSLKGFYPLPPQLDEKTIKSFLLKSVISILDGGMPQFDESQVVPRIERSNKPRSNSY